MKLNFHITKQFMNRHFILFEHLLSLVHKYCYWHTCKVFSIRQFFTSYVQITKYLFNYSMLFLIKQRSLSTHYGFLNTRVFVPMDHVLHVVIITQA